MQTSSEKSTDTTLQVALNMLNDIEGNAWLSVNGDSMTPLLQQGDQVLVEFNPEHLRLGEIVLVQRKTELVTHRLLEISYSSDGESAFLTKGDNRVNTDPVINKAHLIGKVIAVKRNSRELWLNTRTWQIINWLLSQIMRIETNLSRVVSRWLENRQNKFIRSLSQILHSGLRTSLKFIQFFANHWQE